MTPKPDDYSRRRFVKATGTAATVGTVGLTTSASATEDNTPPQGLIATELQVEPGDRGALIAGFLSRYNSVGASPPVQTLADRMRNEFTANTDAWLGYGNWLIDEYDDVSPLGTVTLGVDVVSTNWLFADDRVETTLEAVYDDETESYTDLEWRLEEPEEPDYKVEIRNKAAEHAADELQTFRTRFIAEDEDEAHELPEPDYVEELKGRYLPSLRFGEESKHVLEILIGELDSKQSA